MLRGWEATRDGRYEITVARLAIRYLDCAGTYYRKNSRQSGEAANRRSALRPLVSRFRHLTASSLTPQKLRLVRDDLIAAGMVRQTINAHINRIRRAYKWAVAEGLVPPDVWQALTALSGLKPGRSAAAESESVKPVSPEAVAAILPFVTPPIAGAIQVQLLTGMRPGEVLIMRGCDLTNGGRIWEYPTFPPAVRIWLVSFSRQATLL